MMITALVMAPSLPDRDRHSLTLCRFQNYGPEASLSYELPGPYYPCVLSFSLEENEYHELAK